MTSSLAISVADLRRAIAGGHPPIVIDVRRLPAFKDSEVMVSGALRRDPEQVRAWVGSLPRASAVVVYCVHGHEVSQGAAAALSQAGIAARYLEGGIEAWKAAEAPLDRKPRNGATRWVTRERPKIDRIACPWLIARFVDAQAEFLYVPAKQVLDVAKEREAMPYDIADVHFSHEGELCSFDAFLKHYRLNDPALAGLATIVRGADTGRPDLAPEAPGLLAASLGLSRMYDDDLEQLEAGMLLYDAFYRWCRDATAETHNWPTNKAKA